MLERAALFSDPIGVTSQMIDDKVTVILKLLMIRLLQFRLLQC